jgi:general secretion pathway protein A
MPQNESSFKPHSQDLSFLQRHTSMVDQRASSNDFHCDAAWQQIRSTASHDAVAMYTTFGVREQPFQLTSDPRFFHPAEPHAAALATLVESVARRKGLVVITGPCGTGKTTVVHTALQILTERGVSSRPISSAFIFNPTFTRDEFLETILAELEIPCTATSRPARLAALHEMLLETQRKGGTSLLLIDEAHLLTLELFEEIRLLSNMDAYEQKWLQIVLCGQLELLTALQRPELRALHQSIASTCSLRPLSFQEVLSYVAERMHSAGFRGSGSPFPTQVLEEIFQLSEGIPRLINLFCGTCLAIACKTHRPVIDFSILEEAAHELVPHEDWQVESPCNSGGAPITAARSMPAAALICPCTAEAPSQEPWQELSQTTAPAERAPVAIDEPPLWVEDIAAATLSQREVIPSSTGNADTPVSLKGSITPWIGAEANQGEGVQYLDLVACVSASVAYLAAQNNRYPATPLAVPRLPSLHSRTAEGPSIGGPTSPAKSRLLTLEAVNRLPRNAPRRSTGGSFRDWLAARRVTRSALAVQVWLRRCTIDLGRDWTRMIGAMQLPEIRKSILCWLRQPVRPHLQRKSR